MRRCSEPRETEEAGRVGGSENWKRIIIGPGGGKCEWFEQLEADTTLTPTDEDRGHE